MASRDNYDFLGALSFIGSSFEFDVQASFLQRTATAIALRLWPLSIRLLQLPAEAMAKFHCKPTLVIVRVQYAWDLLTVPEGANKVVVAAM
eukprot:scaffold166030_cov32-Prasinocladus_malaysianus.AAC.2